MNKHSVIRSCAVAAGIAFAPAGLAATTYELDRVISGNPLSTPFVTFNNNNGGVELVIGGLQLGAAEFMRTAWLNFSGNASNLSFTHLSGQAADLVLGSNNGFTLGSPSSPAGVFDIQFSYDTDPNARFEAGEVSHYLISGPGVRESMFSVLDQTGKFFAAANMLNAGGAGGTGGAGIVGAIPEPETYAMILAGLALLGFMVNRRKKTVIPAF